MSAYCISFYLYEGQEQAKQICGDKNHKVFALGVKD